MSRLVSLLASASLFTFLATPVLADYTLNILHMNDWHSRIEPINAFEANCTEADAKTQKCFGGAARLVTAVKERRLALENENVILLNGGDNFQGSLFYTTYKGSVEAEFLNLMGTDAMVVGNHEFDDGEDGLARFLEQATFPVLGSNIKAKQASRLGDRVKDYVILERDGEKIAIVGAVTNDTPLISSPGKHVSIIEDIDGIKAAIEKVTILGINKIIALTHVGYHRDLETIAKLPGVDVVVGGHSHSLLSNKSNKTAGPYPTWVHNSDGYLVPVVQAGSYSMHLGELKVIFNDDGIVKHAFGDTLLLNHAISMDETVVARVKELAAPIETITQTIISETSSIIDGSRENCRSRECMMGSLVTNAILERTKNQGVSIVLVNGGSLRASIQAGPITMGDILLVLPFQNTLATAQYSGKDIIDALENGVSQLEEGAGRFLQVAGLRYSFNKSAAVGDRVKDIQVHENEIWAPIDPNKIYTVATTNFLRSGGDGFMMLSNNAQNAYDFGPNLEDLVADYLKQYNPYQAAEDGRITELSAL